MNNGFGRRWALGLGLAMVACIGLGAWASRATAGGANRIPPQVPRIATVNLEELFPLLKEGEARLKALVAKQNEFKAKLTALDEEIKNDKAKIEAEPNGPNRLAMAKAKREKVLRADFEGKYASNLLVEMEGELYREMYLKISAAAKVVAKRDGYQLVMTSDEKAQIDPENVQRAISLRRMLYVDPDMDITADIALYLNNQFAAGVTSPASASVPNKTP